MGVYFVYSDTSQSGPTDEEAPMFHRWILFDDLWLAAHRDLGESLLRYAVRWDPLSHD